MNKKLTRQSSEFVSFFRYRFFTRDFKITKKIQEKNWRNSREEYLKRKKTTSAFEKPESGNDLTVPIDRGWLTSHSILR